MWSLTTPMFCMNAYTLVGPMKAVPLVVKALGVEPTELNANRYARLP
ncbi:MAG: hypothetical protein QOJ47_1954, partial [Gaiellales bacterium]|nr:hypothetical protein [Gaiellales bacterium]